MQHPHPDTPISLLRQRLIDDMNLRRFSRETQRNYLRDIGRLAAFLGRSPDTATADDLRRFQIEQQEDGVPVPTMNSIVSALRFLFIHTLDRLDLARRLVRLAHRRNLPVVLSRDEVARLLNATTCLKDQAALSVAYGAGLRVAEVSMLKVADVDSERMLLRVERGKGGRYRNAIPRSVARQYTQIVITDITDQTRGRDFGVIADRTWRMTDMGLKQELTLAGLGWGGLPYAKVAGDIHDGRLVLLDLEDYPVQQFPLVAMHHVARPPGPATLWMIERFRTILLEVETACKEHPGAPIVQGHRSVDGASSGDGSQP